MTENLPPTKHLKETKESNAQHRQSMEVKTIKAQSLCRMSDSEGLILQGCGGDLNEWVDGINNLLTEAGILQDGTKFKMENCRVFTYEGLTNLLFLFTDDVKLDMGRLAMWRLKTHDVFSGMWLSDYVSLRLGDFTQSVEDN